MLFGNQFRLFCSTVKNKPIGFWEEERNIKQFLQELQVKLNLKTPKELNTISQKQIRAYGGGSLFKKYSMLELKCIGWPEAKSYFSPNPKSKGYWKDKKNILQLLEEVKVKHNLHSFKEWNELSWKQIKEVCGNSSILTQYSLYELKCLACPDSKSFFTASKPQNYWDDKTHVEAFLKDIEQKYNLNSPEDWNSITINQIKSKTGGKTLLNKYSLHELKCIGSPNYNFNPSYKPVGYWDNQQNVENFLYNIQEKLNLRTIDDWNLITRKTIQKYGGGSLLNKYSMFELKCIGFPSGVSVFNQPSQFKFTGYWKNEKNVKNFLNDLQVKLNLNTPEDWNSITKKQIEYHGGSALFHIYSLFELKCIACPEGKSYFDLSPKPPGFWDENENIKTFLNELKQKLNLQTPEDWNRLSKAQIKAHGGLGLTLKLPLEKIVQFQNPEFNDMDLIECGKKKRSSQRWLFLQIQKLFPGEEIVEDYFHSEISRESGFSVQFDIFLINRNIAFEYHGKQHYEDIPSAFANVEMYTIRDKEKSQLCKKYGIDLVVVPYWWNNHLESLKSTLLNQETLK